MGQVSCGNCASSDSLCESRWRGNRLATTTTWLLDRRLQIVMRALLAAAAAAAAHATSNIRSPSSTRSQESLSSMASRYVCIGILLACSFYLAEMCIVLSLNAACIDTSLSLVL